MVALLGGIGVAQMRVQHVSPAVDELDPDGVLYREPLIDGLGGVPVEPPAAPARVDPGLAVKSFTEARLAAEEYGLELHLPEPGAPDPARAARQETAYVTCDGRVRTCCGGEPEAAEVPPGRLGDHTFADLWTALANRHERNRHEAAHHA
jgi:hypothetical protein